MSRLTESFAARLAAPVAWPLLTGLVCLLSYILISAKGITWGDSPEVAQAVYGLGVMHPTGYPLFTLGNKVLISLLFFIEDPAQRLNYVVGAWGAAAVVLLALSVQTLLRHLDREHDELRPCHRGAGVLTGLLYGLSYSFMEQARIAEVYTFHVFLVALTLYIWLRFVIEHERKWVLWAALTMGLGLAHHLTITHLFPAALLLLLVLDRRFFLTRRFPLALLIGVAPLLFYLYLPIADQTTKAFPWGGTSEWGNFRYHVTGQHYHHFLFESAATFWNHLSRLPEQIATQLQWGGMLFLVLGFGILFRRCAPYAGFLALYLAAGLAHAMGYNVGDYRVYLCAPFYVISLITGVGLGWFLGSALPCWLTSKRTLIATRISVYVVVLSAIFGQAAVDGYAFASKPALVPAMAEQMAKTVPAGGLLLMPPGTRCYASWYTQNVRGIGKGFAAINLARVRNPWYTDYLKRNWPYVDLPNIPNQRRVLLAALKKYVGRRPVFTKDLFTRDQRLPSSLQLVNRGFASEVIPSDNAAPAVVMIRESYLTDRISKQTSGLPRMTFASDERIFLVVSWKARKRRVGELRWIAPDGSVQQRRDLDIAKSTRRSWFSLTTNTRHPEGDWRVQIVLDETLALELPFVVRD